MMRYTSTRRGILNPIYAVVHDERCAGKEAFVDVMYWRVVCMDVFDAEQVPRLLTMRNDRARFRRIPCRSEVESMKAIQGFMRRYGMRHPDTFGAFDAADDALDLAEMPRQWRAILGENHTVVVAFDYEIAFMIMAALLACEPQRQTGEIAYCHP